MSSELILFKNLSLFLNTFSFIQVIIAVALPDILDSFIKTWLLILLGIIFLGLTIGLVLSKTKDSVTLRFLIILSSFISGVVFGVSLVLIFVKVKNGGHLH